jgi:lipopolysaccharide biosynthesis glycosyltransferase
MSTTSTSKDAVHVVCACNAGYMMPMTVMLSSLVDHFDRDRDLTIHVLNSNSTQEQRDGVTKSLKMMRPDWNRVRVKWYSVVPPNLAVKQVRRHTHDIFSRFLAPFLLPEEIDRALYLDCDIVVLKDIGELWDSTAGSPAVVHAVHDLTIPWVSSRQGVFDYKDRGIPADAPYFNSGVLLIHLKRWRERDLTNRLIEYLSENGPKVNEADQGALNALLWNEWEKINQRWNSHSCLNVTDNRKETGLSAKEWHDLRLHPWLVHYTAYKKPWMKGVVFPRYTYFYSYLQRTVYKDTIPHRPKLEDYLGVRAYYHLWNFLRKLPRPRRAAAPPEPSADRLMETKNVATTAE